MSECILNALPLTDRERAQFLSAAPGVEQRFAPLMDNSGLTVPLSDPALADRLSAFKADMARKVAEKDKKIQREEF